MEGIRCKNCGSPVDVDLSEQTITFIESTCEGDGYHYHKLSPEDNRTLEIELNLQEGELD